MHQAQPRGGALGHQFAPQGQRAADAAAEKCLIDGFGGIKAPDARADLRMRAERRATAQLAARVAHLDGVASLRIAGGVINGAGKNPGMYARQQFFAAGLEDDAGRGFHVVGASAVG